MLRPPPGLRQPELSLLDDVLASGGQFGPKAGIEARRCSKAPTARPDELTYLMESGSDRIDALDVQASARGIMSVMKQISRRSIAASSGNGDFSTLMLFDDLTGEFMRMKDLAGEIREDVRR